MSRGLGSKSIDDAGRLPTDSEPDFPRDGPTRRRKGNLSRLHPERFEGRGADRSDAIDQLAVTRLALVRVLVQVSSKAIEEVFDLPVGNEDNRLLDAALSANTAKLDPRTLRLKLFQG